MQMAQEISCIEKKIQKCFHACCCLTFLPYIETKYIDYRLKQKKQKAGACIFDSKTNKILLVLSRGYVWGCPKGSMEEEDEGLVENCAIREVKEEVGIELEKTTLQRFFKIDKTTYYFIDQREFEPVIQKESDANGIGWMKISCVKEMLSTGDLKLNSHCKKIIEKFF